MAIAMVVILGMAGLAIDLGRGYLEDLRLGRAVDAGVLTGARSLRLGQTIARQQALAVAGLNDVQSLQGLTPTISFGMNSFGENTVTMTVARTMPTVFMRVLGQNQMNIQASATATVPPVDMTLVIDQSGSLGTQNAWDDLQQAAIAFVQQFDDSLDQVGLVSFQVRAADRFQINNAFTNPIINAINAMNSAGYTNMGEAFRYAFNQMQSPNLRPRSVKVVVFFTDGRPTAFRGSIGPPGGELDRIMIISQVITGTISGYFDDPDNLPIDSTVGPDGCQGVPSCFAWVETAARLQGQQNGLYWADQIRSQDVIVYTIGLGNPNASDPLWQPDLGYLDQLANVNGMTNPNQPIGKSYFAPSVAELQTVFNLVAQDILVRLSQ